MEQRIFFPNNEAKWINLMLHLQASKLFSYVPSPELITLKGCSVGKTLDLLFKIPGQKFYILINFIVYKII